MSITVLKGLSPILIPYKGYLPGWNIILYCNRYNTMDDIIAALMNSELFHESQSNEIAQSLLIKGWLTITFSKKKEAYMLQDEFKKIGMQTEIIHVKDIKKKTSTKFKLKDEIFSDKNLYNQLINKFDPGEFNKFFNTKK